MRRSRRLALLVLASFACATIVRAAPQRDLTQTGYLQRIVPVAGGVWLLAQPKFQVQPEGNVTVIEQRDGLVLVDAGGTRASGARIVDLVRSLSAKPVKAVIISQWHGDKAQGLSEILKAWPRARTISTSTTRDHLRNPATMNTPGQADAAANRKLQALLQGYRADIEDAALKADTPLMRDRYRELAFNLQQYARDMDGTFTLATREGITDRLDLGDPNAPVEILYPGRANTDGDAVVWLPRHHIVIAGETVILPFPYGFESYPGDWIAVLEKIRQMPFTTLLPGHGMPQHDRAQIDRIIAALNDVRRQVAPLAAAGLSVAQVQANVNLDADAMAFVGDDPWLRKWFKSFWAAPIVASAYKEAKGEPIVQSLGG
jgi:glyoxylase-like metal-dependent hydrolase (beta-lactamase superfamily II)